MAAHEHENGVRLRDVNWWYVLAAVSGSITVVAALGEWVFHWWREPGDLVSVIGLFVTLLALGFGASRSQVRRMFVLQVRTLAAQERVADELRALREGQERQTRAFEEAVAFFRSTRA